MIPRDYITEWRAHAPWVQDFQVEQDLVISRALVEIFSHAHLRDALALRGGTAIYKLHLKPPARYSEDIGPLLAAGFDWNIKTAAPIVLSRLIRRLPGAPWKGGG